MSTITLEIPQKLATRLKPYREKLPEILELGLAQIEAAPKPAVNTRERTLQALKASGVIQPLNLTRVSGRPRSRRRSMPLKLEGKPLSEIIIEQRGSW